MGCHALLQGIFLTQGLNLRASPALQTDSLPLCHLGRPHTHPVKTPEMVHIKTKTNNKKLKKKQKQKDPSRAKP